MNDERYVFVVEWYDSAACLVRSYNLTYYTKDSTIQMFDLKNKRSFLKRSDYPALHLQDIFVGATINVYSRQLKVVDYADQFTRGKFDKQKGKTLAIIKPDGYFAMGKIINMIEQAGFTINNLKMIKLSEQQAQRFYSQNKNRPDFRDNAIHLSSDNIVVLELVGQSCVNKFLNLIGTNNPQIARKQNPNSIRSKFGTNQIKNAIYGSQNSNTAIRQLQYFFSTKSTWRSTACFNNCTCLIIKPHIIAQGYVGQIIDRILTSQFEISAMQMFSLDRPSAQEFLQIYKTILPEYHSIVDELISGPCIALEIRGNNVVVAVRELCGHHEPQLAKQIKPKSIRAAFGRDKVRNGVHCTDLAQDALIEVQYFFNILQK